jgi:hypothetical protein
MSTPDVESNIDQIRELCRQTLKTLRAASEDSQYGAAVDQAVARRRLCIQVFDGWYGSLSKRAKHAFRKASEYPWDGDSLSRLTIWGLRMAPQVGEKTQVEIVESLRALGIEMPEDLRGSVVVHVDRAPSA